MFMIEILHAIFDCNDFRFRPVFEFSTSLEKCDEEVPNHLDSDSVEEIKRDLMFAIQGKNHEKTDTCYLFGIFPNRVVHSNMM